MIMLAVSHWAETYWGWFRFLESPVLPKLDKRRHPRISKKLLAQLLPICLYILKVYFIVVSHIINLCILNIVLPLSQDTTVLMLKKRISYHLTDYQRYCVFLEAKINQEIWFIIIHQDFYRNFSLICKIYQDPRQTWATFPILLVEKWFLNPHGGVLYGPPTPFRVNERKPKLLFSNCLGPTDSVCNPEPELGSTSILMLRSVHRGHIRVTKPCE